MKIKFRGKIGSITAPSEKTLGLVRIELSLKGAVEGEALTAKESFLDGVLDLKPLVAEKLKIGTTIVVEVSEEE